MQTVTETEIAKAFLDHASRSSEFEIAYSLVAKHAQGHVWLIGGFLYRTIAHRLYGAKMPGVDLDFIVENPVDSFVLPIGWSIERNSFGNPRFVGHHEGRRVSIDYVPLSTVHYITSRGLQPTIDNYLTGTPLTVQSMAFNCLEMKLVGDIGIKAIIEKKVGVNNESEARYLTERRGILLSHYLREKAETLGFTAVMSQRPMLRANLRSFGKVKKI